jgi:carotenoid cleavage dioxygenase-like enzyme
MNSTRSMNPTLTPSPDAGYRSGFESLDREVNLDALPIEGVLPAWLTGTLLRNGPARFAVGTEQYRHWFDGLAMLHRFSIGGGMVSYANRFLGSPAFREAERTGRIARAEFATDPKRTLLERLTSGFGSGSSDNANVNIVPFADGYLALTETPSPVAFDGESLATRGVLAYEDNVAGQVTTAHTHHDRRRRATFNIVIEMGRTSRYAVVRIEDGTLRRTVIASIAVDEPAYVHAFSATERYIVLAEFPLVVRPLDLLLRRKPFIDNYRWKPQRGTRFHVVEKESGARAGTYEADACFAFHHINAFEQGDSITVDLCAYDDAAIIGDLMLDRLRATGGASVARPTFRRYRLVAGRSAAEVEPLSAASIELPRVAPDRAAAAYRYAYGVASAPDGSDLFNTLVKLDVRSASVASWSAPSAHPGEPIFVARPDAVDEDDGVLLSVVLDAAAARSYLLVLDARTLDECARALVPHHIPFGFHGLFGK